MPIESHASLIEDLRLRATGIANNLSLLAGVGLTQEAATEGQAHANRLEQLNAEQEALKAALKLKTAEYQAALKEARVWRTRVTQLIKVALAKMQQKWIEFGITAKK